MSKPIFFSSPQHFYEWLELHHDTAAEVYVGYWKKHTGRPSLTWSEAVDQALCFGWIDGRVNRIDGDRHMQRFTPRRPGSNWSNVNTAKVATLEKQGRMRPAGRAAFERRVESRSGVYTYEQDGEAALPPEYERRFRAHAGAWSWFESQAPSYRRTAVRLVMSAKREETRERRLARLIEDSAAGLRIKELRAPR